MEVLLHVGHHAQVQLPKDTLFAAHGALDDYIEVVRKSAEALRLVADSRDAFVYYRVGEQLGLRWDFGDAETTSDISRRIDRAAADKRPLFSSVACANRALAQLESSNKQEQAALWLRELSNSLADLRNCADLLDAAAAVVDYQLRGGISMEVTAVCADGSALKALASEMRELADAIANAR